MDREKLVRIWFGAVRDASDAGERGIPENICLNPLQRARLRILLRRNACDLLNLCISEAENISLKEANEIWADLYSELMEDAIAGIWGEEENYALACFLESCSEGIGDADDFCTFFLSALGKGQADGGQKTETVARQVKKSADECLDAFIRKRQNQRPQSYSDDGPPPWMDEFEYIDWQMTH